MTLFRSAAAEDVEKTWVEAKRLSELARRREATRRLAVYHDDYREYVTAQLRRVFHPDVWSRYREALDVAPTANPLRWAHQELSSLYTDPPSRRGDPRYLDWCAEVGLDAEIFSVTEPYASLLNTVCIAVLWDADLRRPEPVVLTPDQMTVWTDPQRPTRPVKIAYQIEAIDSPDSDGARWVVWTPEEHYIVGTRGERIAPEGNPDMVNPYPGGFMPFVFARQNGVPGQFWSVTTGSDLVDATIQAAKKMAQKNHVYDHQSCKTAWITGDLTDRAKERVFGPGVVMLLEPGSSTGVIDTQAEFGSLSDDICADIDMTLRTYGLSYDAFRAAASNQSGKYLEMKGRALRDRRKRTIPIFRRVENQLYAAVSVVWRYHAGVTLSDDFGVDFTELPIYADEARELELWRARCDAGLVSPGEFYLAWNPDVGTAEAGEARLRENLESWKALRDSTAPLTAILGAGK